ncbi:hypothetical protein WJX84_001825 [Apatococcus fuscideae]|uniref:SET domain-containing protein n=1 Tax=Apatococcus fuscideae TaxID=2026836 RepID=A0AAW1T4C9_9CHLO
MAQETAEEPVLRLSEWLESLGADLSGIGFEGSVGHHRLVAGTKPCQSLQCSLRSRFMDFVTRRDSEVHLARFPLDQAFTARSIINHSIAGPGYQQASRGLMDERELIIFALMTERLKGSKSPWEPWISALPNTFDTPAYYSDVELEELKGTNLYQAARLLKQQMAAVWKRLEPLCVQLLREEGIHTDPPCVDDLIWGYSTFWSRGQAIPVSLKDVTEVEEGLVPGLDMCNHSVPARARWQLQPAQASDSGPSNIFLMVERSTACRPGAEVTIDYGDKSNEELLLLYGFCTDTRNMNDQLMIPLLDTGSMPDDPTMEARLMLLEQHGCKPQLFLPFQLMENIHRPPAESRHLGSSCYIPRTAFDTLQIWCMSRQQLAEELSRKTPAKLPEPDAASKADLLDLLVHLLAKTVERLEGPQGTESLEADLGLLNRAEELPQRMLHSIIYRAGQKKLARHFLQQAERAALEQMGAPSPSNPK